MEDQERVFQRLRTEMTEEMRESEKASAGTEGRAHFAVGWGGSCSVSLRTLEELPEAGPFFSFSEHTLLPMKTTGQLWFWVQPAGQHLS